MLEEYDDQTENEILTKVVRRTDVDGECAQELFERTTSRVSKTIEDDDHAYLEDEDEARRIAAVCVYTLLRVVDDDPFEKAWTEFIEQDSDFDIGLMYQTVFPERATEVLQNVNANDY